MAKKKNKKIATVVPSNPGVEFPEDVGTLIAKVLNLCSARRFASTTEWHVIRCHPIEGGRKGIDGPFNMNHDAGTLYIDVKRGEDAFRVLIRIPVEIARSDSHRGQLASQFKRAFENLRTRAEEADRLQAAEARLRAITAEASFNGSRPTPTPPVASIPPPENDLVEEVVTEGPTEDHIPEVRQHDSRPHVTELKEIAQSPECLLAIDAAFEAEYTATGRTFTNDRAMELIAEAVILPSAWDKRGLGKTLNRALGKRKHVWWNADESRPKRRYGPKRLWNEFARPTLPPAVTPVVSRPDPKPFAEDNLDHVPPALRPNGDDPHRRRIHKLERRVRELEEENQRLEKEVRTLRAWKAVQLEYYPKD